LPALFQAALFRATALDYVNNVDAAILTKEGAVNIPSPGVCVPGALTIAVALATAVLKPEAEETRATWKLLPTPPT
jgi:hypothetical protein